MTPNSTRIIQMVPSCGLIHSGVLLRHSQQLILTLHLHLGLTLTLMAVFAFCGLRWNDLHRCWADDNGDLSNHRMLLLRHQS